MSALADKVHKQGMPHSSMHSITKHGHIIQQQPFIINWRATATYVGMVVE